MFERRLKLFLLFLGLVVLVLMGRAAQVQIINREYWKTQAAEALKLTHLVETSRGNIADRDGNILAIDKPCIDACIDYRALTTPPDAEWVKAKALARLRLRQGDGWSKLSARQKAELRDREIIAVNSAIERMWGRLAQVHRSADGIDDDGGADAVARCRDEILQRRDAIVQRVEMRQRFVWYKRYEEAMAKGGKKVETTQWKRWIANGGDDAPAIDSFNVTVAEQLESHVIRENIDVSAQNELAKNIDAYPGLVLRPGTHRTYPYNDIACHLLGHLARVDADDLKESKATDEVRQYLRNDLIGKTGIESLCEPSLRGTRGKIDRALGDETVLASIEPVPGQDVRLSIDIELQQQIQASFTAAVLRDSKNVITEDGALLHGAAVVLDVDTNQVLAMVSYPTYDLNHFDELYPSLRDDVINDPLNNRATMSQLEPGSTIKPLCGLAAITQGVVGVTEGIECTGVFKIAGRVIPGGARCWVSSRFGELLRSRGMSDAHHPIPFPHVGHDGNPDGFLTYADGLERSCNIYFETCADRLGIDRLSDWYEKFGLGRPTGIGIGEMKGRLPRNFPADVPALRRITGFLGGIGQGYVAATPIQMANAASMIARNGIWMRPVLVLPGPDGKYPPMRPGTWQTTPDRVDLQLPPEALRAAHEGMFNVVNARAGTGTTLVVGDKMLQELGVCGKTGTAQAARFSIIVKDSSGKPMLDENKQPVRQYFEPGPPGHPNKLMPWYRSSDAEGKELNHAWYIGFAPAKKPKIAFAVMIEYGGSGGIAAASVAREALSACVARGYLHPHSESDPTAAPARTTRAQD